MSSNKRRILIFLTLTLIVGRLASQAVDDSVLFMKGFDAFKRGMFSEAAAAFEGLARETADEGMALESAYMGVLSLINLGDLDAAMTAADAFLALVPEGERAQDIRYQKGRILFLKGNHAIAADEFSTFIRSFPDNVNAPSALFWRAESLYLLGRKTEAFEEFSRFVERYPAHDKISTAAWRLEVMGLESRESKYLRLIEFDKSISLQRREDDERVERYNEHALEREYLLLRELRALYGFPGVGKIPLYAEKTISEVAVPVTVEVKTVETLPCAENPAETAALKALEAQKELLDIELGKIDRLRELLAAKDAVLQLLLLKIEQYVEEVSR